MLWVFYFALLILLSFCPGCYNLIIVGIICVMLYLDFLVSGSLSALKIHNCHILQLYFVDLTRHIFLFRVKVIYVRSAFWMQDLFEPVIRRTNVLHSIKLKTQLHNVLFLKRIFIKKYCNKRLQNSVLKRIRRIFCLREWK